MSGAARDENAALARDALIGLLGARWRDARIEPVEGTTNLVARATLGRESVALRIPRLEDDVVQVDRESECAALTAAAGAQLAPRLVACEPASGVLITQWIDGGVWSFERAREPGAIDLIGAALRRLHALEVPETVRRIEFEALIARYLARLEAASDSLLNACRELQPLAAGALAASHGSRTCLCHCDVHHDNLIEARGVKAGAIVLLDWEYAGVCDPMFDVAAYASYHALDAPACTRLLAAHDPGEANAGLPVLRRWRWIFDYVWLLWLRVSARPETRVRTGSLALLERLRSETPLS